MNYQEILEELKWNSCSYAEEDCYNCNVEDKQACSNMRILCKQAAKMMEEIKKERDELKAEMEYLANDPNAPIEMFCKKWTTHGCCCYNENGERISECKGFEWRGVQE